MASRKVWANLFVMLVLIILLTSFLVLLLERISSLCRTIDFRIDFESIFESRVPENIRVQLLRANIGVSKLQFYLQPCVRQFGRLVRFEFYRSFVLTYLRDLETVVNTMGSIMRSLNVVSLTSTWDKKFVPSFASSIIHQFWKLSNSRRKKFRAATFLILQRDFIARPRVFLSFKY